MAQRQPAFVSPKSARVPRGYGQEPFVHQSVLCYDHLSGSFTVASIHGRLLRSALNAGSVGKITPKEAGGDAFEKIDSSGGLWYGYPKIRD